MAVWMDLMLVSAALLPWVMSSRAGHDAKIVLSPVAVKTAVDPEDLPRRAPEF
jgi:hypothetical protein